MVITLPPDLASALSEQARRRVAWPRRRLALDALRASDFPSRRSAELEPPRGAVGAEIVRGRHRLRRLRARLGLEQRWVVRIMAFLIDTSILGRLANRADAAHPVAVRAIAELHRRGEVLHITAQNLVEVHQLRHATHRGERPGVDCIGGVTCWRRLSRRRSSLLNETPAIYPAWKALVGALGVVGKQVHDARLVAVCHANGVSHLLTFNMTHFVRMAAFGPGVTVVHPASV